jgi:hypothetical protein
MPVDYSKWDHLDEYSEDEDSTGGEVNASMPRITRLDTPSAVTFGGGSGDGSASIKPSNSEAVANSDALVHARIKADSSNMVSVTRKSSIKDSYENWKTRGGMVTTITLGHQRRLFWSQDRYSVCLRLELQNLEKVKNVKVDGAVSYVDRFCAVGTSKPSMHAESEDKGSCILQGKLPHPVHFAQDDDEGDIEWSVERSTSDERFLAVTFFKAVPMAGLVIWWRRPLMDFEEIEVVGSEKSSKNSQEFLDAWKEAHNIFREKKKASG